MTRVLLPHLITLAVIVSLATTVVLQGRLISAQTSALRESNDRYEELQKNARCSWLWAVETTATVCGCDSGQGWAIEQGFDGSRSCRCLDYVPERRKELRECDERVTVLP